MCSLIALKTVAVQLLGDRLYTKSALYTRMSLFTLISHRKSHLHYKKILLSKIGKGNFYLKALFKTIEMFSLDLRTSFIYRNDWRNIMSGHLAPSNFFILTLDDVEALSVMVFLQAQELSTIL